MDELYFLALKTTPSAQEHRRAKILQTVVEILAREGVDELTFEKIGRRAGMARSHVVYYFDNREALVTAAIQFAALSAQRIVSSSIDSQADWKAQLRACVEGNFEWIRTCPEHVTVYMLLYYLATFKKEYREMHSEIREVGAQRLEAILLKGPMRWKKKQARQVAKAIQSLISGNIIDVTTTSQYKQLTERKQQTLEQMEILLKAEGA